jgi:hypothetical protein
VHGHRGARRGRAEFTSKQSQLGFGGRGVHTRTHRYRDVLMSKVISPSGLGYSRGVQSAASLSFSWSAYLWWGQGRQGTEIRAVSHLCNRGQGRQAQHRRHRRAGACCALLVLVPGSAAAHAAAGTGEVGAPVSESPRLLAPQQVRLHRAVGQAAPQAAAQPKAGPNVALSVQLGVNLRPPAQQQEGRGVQRPQIQPSVLC